MTNEQFVSLFNEATSVTLSFSLPEGYTLDDVVDTITPTTVYVDTEEVPGLFLLFVLVENLKRAGKRAGHLVRDNGAAQWSWS